MNMYKNVIRKKRFVEKIKDNVQNVSEGNGCGRMI
jgi:hypothetical protein